MTKKRITDTAKYRTVRKMNAEPVPVWERAVMGFAASTALVLGCYNWANYAPTHRLVKDRTALYQSWPHDTFTVTKDNSLWYCALSQRQYGQNTWGYLKFIEQLPYNTRIHRWEPSADATGSLVDSIGIRAIHNGSVDAGTQIILPHNPRYRMDCAVPSPSNAKPQSAPTPASKATVADSLYR